MGLLIRRTGRSHPLQYVRLGMAATAVLQGAVGLMAYPRIYADYHKLSINEAGAECLPLVC